MNIALVGLGRMGQEIERLAPQLGHDICARFDQGNPLLISSSLDEARVLIDFSSGSAVWATLEIAAQRRIPVVEGTTGWEVDTKRLEAMQGLTLVYSPNFSLGIYEFMKAVSAAAERLGRLGAYDCYVREIHHSGKADSPSGTAKKLAQVLLQKLPGKNSALFENCNRQIQPEELHVTSTRAGKGAGIHEVGFDSDHDLIEFRHTARDRSGFAYGALRAAEWIVGRSGIYSMENFVSSLHQE